MDKFNSVQLPFAQCAREARDSGGLGAEAASSLHGLHSGILVQRRVMLVELDMMLGHRGISGTTSTYTVFDPDYLSCSRDGIEDVVADLTRM